MSPMVISTYVIITNITSGTDEDAMSALVALKLLTDKKIYSELMDL